MSKHSSKILTIPLTIVVCLFAVFPFIWMISTSFKPPEEIYKLPTLFPENPTLQGYIDTLTKSTTNFSFLQWGKNSFIISVCTTVFSLIVSTLGGYGMSRFQFTGKGSLGYVILITQVLPGSLLILPLYIIMINLNLLNSLIGLVLAYTTFSVPFCTWMMKGYFDTIPVSLDEAAMVDGCNRIRTFLNVVLPLTKPGLAATGIFSFIAGWNEYLFASQFAQSYDKWTLPVGLASFSGQYTTNWGALMAGSVMVTIPVIVIFLVLQKYLVSGMTAGAVKQ